MCVCVSGGGGSHLKTGMTDDREMEYIFKSRDIYEISEYDKGS